MGSQRNVLRREGRAGGGGKSRLGRRRSGGPPDEHDCDRTAHQKPRERQGDAGPASVHGSREAHPVNLGFRLPLVFGAEVTKFVASTSLTTFAFDVGWSKALPAGTIPAM